MSNAPTPKWTVQAYVPEGMYMVSDFEARTGILWVADGGEELANKVAALLNMDNEALALVFESRENFRRQRNHLQRKLN